MGFGLLQLWSAVLILLNAKKDINIRELLGDGGLFFFATSVVASGGLLLIERKRLGTPEILFSLVAMLTVAAPCLLLYGAVSAGQVGNSKAVPFPFSNLMPAQIGLAVWALAYAMFAAARTKQFSK